MLLQERRSFAYSLLDAFMDPDGDALAFSVELENGGSLPSWILFDADEKLLYGLPGPSEVGLWRLKITATDSMGVSTDQTFSLVVDAINGDDDITVVDVNGERHVLGTSGDDVIEGESGIDYLYGHDGNDTLIGSDGEFPVDYATNEYLDGGAGDDVYLYKLRAPVVVIDQGSAGMNDTDVLRFDPVFTPDILVFSHINRQTLLIETIYGNPLVMIEDWWDPQVKRISHVEYGDGTTISASEIDARISTGYYAPEPGVVEVTTYGEATAWVWGSGADETFNGSTSDDLIWAAEGDDVIAGGAGTDVLQGEAGSDLYRVARGDGEDRIIESRSDPADVDVVQFGSDVAFDQLWFDRWGDDLRVSIVGTADRLTIEGWYLESPGRIEEFRSGDGHLLLESQVQNLVQAMASFAPPAAGQTTLPPGYASSLSPTLAASWQ